MRFQFFIVLLATIYSVDAFRFVGVKVHRLSHRASSNNNNNNICVNDPFAVVNAVAAIQDRIDKQFADFKQEVTKSLSDQAMYFKDFREEDNNNNSFVNDDPFVVVNAVAAIQNRIDKQFADFKQEVTKSLSDQAMHFKDFRDKDFKKLQDWTADLTAKKAAERKVASYILGAIGIVSAITSTLGYCFNDTIRNIDVISLSKFYLVIAIASLLVYLMKMSNN